MRKFLASCAVVIAGATATALVSAAVIPVQTKGGDVTVTASYKGKGTVDPTHEILVFLFDHPTPTADSRPLQFQTITKNGQTVTFKNVTVDPVYVTMVFDEKANYDGNSPPPAGSPVSTYSKAGKPVPVKPGSKVVASFDDTRRWK
jgi:hypothetical protein